MKPNNHVAADVIEILVMMQRFLVAAEHDRYAAPVIVEESGLKVVCQYPAPIYQEIVC